MYISIKNLNKTIKGKIILEDISMELKKGGIYGLQGINGSGKTMLMRAICGLIHPTSGTIVVNGMEIGKDCSFPQSLGILIENPAFISRYTGLKNLMMLASLQDKVSEIEVREALIRVGLNPDDKRTYRKYSLGMKQRLGVACAVMEHPDLIILDEPINSLDEEGIQLVRNLILLEKERGALIILSCHDKDELKILSDEIYIISEGKIKEHHILGEVTG